MLSLLLTLIPFTLFNLAVVLIPGLDFVFVSRTTLLSGRHAGLKAALGVTAGCTIWGIAGFLGVQAIFKMAPWLYLGVKACGGTYLVYSGIQLIHPARLGGDAPTPTVRIQRSENHFVKGLLCDLANPKALIFTISLFASCFPQNAPLWLGAAAVIIIFGCSAGWCSLVALFLSAPSVAKWFFSRQRQIDLGAGALFMGLGGMFIWEALFP